VVLPVVGLFYRDEIRAWLDIVMGR
jgi:hypothetical protein